MIELEQQRLALAAAEAALDARDLECASVLYEHAAALGVDPDRCAAGEWMIAMLRGDFEAAWKKSDAIRARGRPDPHRFWNGESVDGRRVMVRCLHGFGDAVQMLRFLPMLTARAMEVTVEVPPRLLELAPFIQGITNVVTWGDDAPRIEPEWEVQLEVMELPYVLRLIAEQLPATTRYLELPRTLRAKVRSHLTSAGPRVGLVWAAGAWNTTRSVPFAMMAELLDVRGCEFWNLQGGADREDWKAIRFRNDLRVGNEVGQGILPLAGLIDQLDLVITVDTLAAHLAGALGRPTWVLLQHAADWRWMHARNDSPWYPTLRLFRQPAPGDWNSVFRQLRQELERWANKEMMALAG